MIIRKAKPTDAQAIAPYMMLAMDDLIYHLLVKILRIKQRNF